MDVVGLRQKKRRTIKITVGFLKKLISIGLNSPLFLLDLGIGNLGLKVIKAPA